MAQALLGALVVLGVLSLLIALSGNSIGQGYRLIVQGAIGIPPSDQLSPLDAWDAVLHDMTLLILTGLSVAIALQAGLFNIGAAGQLLMGAMVAGWIGTRSDLPTAVHLPLTLSLGALVGALWALVPALLKLYRGAHEVITTIMFNYIALYLTHWLLMEHLQDPTSDVPRTAFLAETAQLPPLGSFMQTSWGFVIAVMLALVLWAVLFRTVWGYEVRATGANRDAAEAGGVPVNRRTLQAMLLAGGMAGLAGAIEVVGTQYRFFEGFPADYGFDGIAVALLGANHPALAVVSAWVMSALRGGTYYLHIETGAPKEIAVIVQAVLILYVAAVYLRKRRVEG